MSRVQDVYLELANLQGISGDLYDELPSVISNQIDQYDLQEERDVYITAALGVLSGCLPMVKGQYDNDFYHPNLYVFIIAPAGGGKGSLKHATELARPIHRMLKKDSNAERARWEQAQRDNDSNRDGAGDAVPNEKPPRRQLIIPGNSSAASVINALSNNDGRGIMIETEADTLSQTIEKEWGNFSDVLRKAHPHEAISSGRVDETQEVDTPELSVVLSGTPDQLPNLIGEVGKGLWSRLCLYGFIPTDEWKDVSPSYAREDEEFSIRRRQSPGQAVKELYQALSCRSSALNIRLKPEQWTVLHEVGQGTKKEVHENYGFAGDGIVHRMGLHIFRIASILAVWNLWDQSEGLSDEEREQVVVKKDTFNTAVRLGMLYAEHNLSLLEAMASDSLGKEVSKLERKWLNALPTQFKTSRAVELGDQYHFSRRTVMRRLKEWTNEGLLTKLKKGHYEKTEEAS